MTVYMAQLLCSQRHCVLAAIHEFESDKAAEALSGRLANQFLAMVNSGALNAKCGICDSTELHIELAATRFTSIEAATPALWEEQERQKATAAFLHSLKQRRN